jgi:hypothetical protein
VLGTEEETETVQDFRSGRDRYLRFMNLFTEKRHERQVNAEAMEIIMFIVGHWATAGFRCPGGCLVRKSCRLLIC